MTFIEFLAALPKKARKDLILAVLYYKKTYDNVTTLGSAQIKEELKRARIPKASKMNVAAALSGAGHLVDRVWEGKNPVWHITDSGSAYIQGEIGDKVQVTKKPGKALKKDTPKKGEALGKVFIVHGHDEAVKNDVARFLGLIGFEAIILHERPNKGRTIIEKFHEETQDVQFAIVLLTPDDVGGKSKKELNPRARQNVIFELGFFRGVLGPNRVVALVKDKVELPSDYNGVVYTAYDARGAWKSELGRELKAAGLEVDMNKIA